MNLQEAFEVGFEAVKAYIERAADAWQHRFSTIEERLGALEKAAGIPPAAPIAARCIEPRAMPSFAAGQGADLQNAFNEGFEAVKGYVDHAFGDCEERLLAIEARLDALAGVSPAKSLAEIIAAGLRRA